MSQESPNESISAYFDGEASPRERAVVQRALRESLVARRELAEIASLSGLLHSFPHDLAPVELVVNVQKQMNQISPVFMPVVASTDRKNSLRREWTSAVLGAVVTAAAVILTFDFVKMTELENSPVTAQSEQKSGGDVARGKARLRPSTISASTPLLNDSVTLNGLDVNPDLAANLALAENGYQSHSVNNSLFINGLKRGEVYQLVPRMADLSSSVAVVYVRVVDLEQGANEIQLLLAKNFIQPRLSGTTSVLNRQNSPSSTVTSGAGEWIAVYANAPGEQLAKTLEEISSHPDLFPTSWKSQPPLQLPVEENSSNHTAGERRSGNKISAMTGRNSETLQIPNRGREKTEEPDSAAVADEAERAVNSFLLKNAMALSDSPSESPSVVEPTTSQEKRVGDVSTKKTTSAAITEEIRASRRNTDVITSPLQKDVLPQSNSINKLAQQPAFQQTIRRGNQTPIRADAESPLSASPSRRGLTTDRNGLSENEKAKETLPQRVASIDSGGVSQAVKVLFVLHPSETSVSQSAPSPRP